MSTDIWLHDPTSPDPPGLSGYFWDNEQLSRRKRYLFVAAVGRLAAPLMTEPACIRMAEVCEEYADGAIDSDTFAARCDEAIASGWAGGPAAEEAAHAFVQFLGDEGKLNECVGAVECAFGYAAAVAAGDLEPVTAVGCAEALQRYPSFRAGCEAADREFARYCRDVFGPNPFALPPFVPAWRTADVVGLARGIYAERAFDRLPILADALQDAGCEDAELLAHCRGSGPHVRGCWVLDLVLGLG